MSPRDWWATLVEGIKVLPLTLLAVVMIVVAVVVDIWERFWGIFLIVGFVLLLRWIAKHAPTYDSWYVVIPLDQQGRPGATMVVPEVFYDDRHGGISFSYDGKSYTLAGPLHRAVPLKKGT